MMEMGSTATEDMDHQVTRKGEEDEEYQERRRRRRFGRLVCDSKKKSTRTEDPAAW